MSDETTDESLVAEGETALLDAAGRVAMDLPCLKCGYNLRTLVEDALCPECAHPVAKTTRNQYLWQSPAVWIGGVALGAQMLAFGIGLALGYIVLAMLASALSSVVADLVLGLIGIPLSIVPIFGLGGLVASTKRDPALLEQREGLTARRVIRWSMALIPLTLAAAFGAGMTVLPAWRVPLPLLTVWAFGAGVLSVGVVPLALWRHVVALMRRVPRPDLVAFASFEFWATAIAEVTLAAVWVTELFSAGWRTYPWNPLWWIAGLVSFTAAVTGFVLLVRVARALNEAHRRALQLALTDRLNVDRSSTTETRRRTRDER